MNSWLKEAKIRAKRFVEDERKKGRQWIEANTRRRGRAKKNNKDTTASVPDCKKKVAKCEQQSSGQQVYCNDPNQVVLDINGQPDLTNKSYYYKLGNQMTNGLSDDAHSISLSPNESVKGYATYPNHPLESNVDLSSSLDVFDNTIVHSGWLT